MNEKHALQIIVHNGAEELTSGGIKVAPGDATLT